MRWSIAQLAYLAGIIDGEGCFYIGRSTRKNLKKFRTICYQTRILVVNTDFILIEWLKSNFGGMTYSRKVRDGWKTKYEWLIASDQAAIITNAVYPYLVIKKPHANVFLRFKNTVGIMRDHGRVKPTSPEVLAIRENCYYAIKHLNHRNSLGS